MKRFHVHLHVQDLDASVAFYSRLFAAQPARVETDYAKWMLDDPRINFAISTRGDKSGVDHLGIQADDDAELGELKGRAERASRHIIYRVAFDRMNGLLGYLTRNCCAGEPCAVDTAPTAACGC